MSILASDGSHYVVPKAFQKANLNSTIDQSSLSVSMEESTASVAQIQSDKTDLENDPKKSEISQVKNKIQNKKVKEADKKTVAKFNIDNKKPPLAKKDWKSKQSPFVRVVVQDASSKGGEKKNIKLQKVIWSPMA